MTVPVQNPSISYVGNGATKAFAFPFAILESADLVVLVDDAEQNVGVQYTIDGIGESSGGTVTFASAPLAGSIITIYREISIERDTDYQDNGDLLADTVNADFDRIWMAIQDGNFGLSHAVRAPRSDINPKMTLPSAAARANKALGFDNAGNPFAIDLTIGSVLTPVLHSIAMLRLVSKLFATDVFVVGYHEAGDGGGGAYYLDPSDHSSDDNSGTVIVAFDGGRWKRAKTLPIGPETFGAVGDGIADDTAAWNALIEVVNVEGLTTISCRGTAKYFVGPLDPVIRSDVNIFGNGAAIIVKPNMWMTSGIGTTHLDFSGATRLSVKDLTIDGNQMAFTIGTTPIGVCFLLGSDPRLENVNVINSAHQGVRQNLSGVSGTYAGTFVKCHFDDNANLGLELNRSQYGSFTGCTFRRNGYGFQRKRPGPSSMNAYTVAFGAALRYRTHHITFNDCEFLDNGREGCNVNQGSYAIKFCVSQAMRNGDGGFTIASDQLHTGLPGDGEACYDIEYIGCEAAGNYTGGLVAYDTAHNVSVIGGRYYNNGMVAGDIPIATSYYNGIYFASGSTGINVDAKVYDDRQLWKISAVSVSGQNAVLTVPNWVAGAMSTYWKVAVYDAFFTFLGYGIISAESNGVVTIHSTPNDGVSIGSIAATQYVTQRVQHNGVLTDNNCDGEIHVDGFGFNPGPTGLNLTGYPVMSGSFNDSQNIRLPKAHRDPNQLLLNPTFDADLSNWTFSTPGGGSAVRNTSNTGGLHTRSPGSLELVAGSSPAFGDATLTPSAELYVDGQWVECRAWVWANGAGTASISLFWGSNPFSTVVSHPGGGRWRLLTICAFIPPGSPNLIFRVGASIGESVFFDNLDMRVVYLDSDNRNYSPISRYLPLD
ncbi:MULTISPECIES: right-handed parallel beta-helix repeat-containing protein [Burkholderia]|uniref:right-handed parallel beta-helix repeat-containing protein n=3 Tax=Bacteria TaxID=2 RepID=UPI000DAE234E|nr:MULTISPECIES: right-handed parallel beta-helix repeat-containing protein [Burkholderia]MDP9549708.1 hypothetical protein [Burkholderia cepacia]MBR8393344.1 hypothetical protein [Burkholderia cenocepacia]MBR8473263.1 hypothetical protein [Burkholderia cenocepacia]MBR8491780.1 hypothetical protein [Burkholderia cenocepacia]MDO5919681.1 hypothetical protein [Burkholderia cenocepacia]